MLIAVMTILTPVLNISLRQPSLHDRRLKRPETGTGRIGEIIKHAVRDTNCHEGGNTHFGAFILLVPLIYGKGIPGALTAIEKTDVSDAVAFYKAFAMTSVKMNPADELDVHDPHTLTVIRDREMTLLDIMRHSATNDMVAREWVTGFPLTRRGADLLKHYGPGTAVHCRYISHPACL